MNKLTPSEFQTKIEGFLIPSCRTLNYLVPLLVEEAHEVDLDADLVEVGDVLFAILGLSLVDKAWKPSEVVLSSEWGSTEQSAAFAHVAVSVIRARAILLLSTHAKILRAPEQRERRIEPVADHLDEILRQLCVIANRRGVTLAHCAQLAVNKLEKRKAAGTITSHNLG